jgi:5-hydroxyisourate hydrolase
MSAITTHVLDTARGRPADGVPVVLEMQTTSAWTTIGSGRTDTDGRVRAGLTSPGALKNGTYRLRFDTGAYFRAIAVEAFFPEVTIVFVIHDALQHHHVPLLLSPFGYSTYRGS